MRYVIVLALLSVVGCSAHFNHQLNFNVREPLRVAILPFVAVDERGQIIQQEGRLVLDNLSLISKNVESTPAQLVRKDVIAEIKKTGLDIVTPALIDIDLPHHGFAKKDGTLDIEKLLAVSPQQLCSSFLSCDAVLYGTVKKWERSYYGLQSVNTVSLELKLVSAKTGAILFQSSGEDHESRGLSKGPTGISSLVLEPLKGLDSEIIGDLANSIVKKMLDPLLVASKPEFVDSSPPAIFAVSHDGNSGLLTTSKPLIVVAYASGGCEASFSIGNVIKNIPLVERSPTHYYGEYLPLPGEHFENQAVTIAVVDAYGRKSAMLISKAPLTLK